MLAGQPPHLGGSAQQIIMKIVTEEATPVTQHRKSVPLNVAAAVAKSLEKLPADRFESAKAFAEALGNPAFRSGRMVAGGEVGGAGRSRTRRALGAVAWCALGAGAVWLGLHFWSAPAGSKDASRQQITYTGRAGSPAISPDGRFVAFIEQRCPEPPATGGCVNLEVLEIGTTTPVEVLTGADHLNTPRWTHDGLSVVIGGALSVGRAGLFVVPRLGGTPRQIADEPLAYDTHPTADSVVLVFARDQGTTLRVIPIAAAQTATPGDTLSLSVSNVAWSPDGQMFAIAAPGEITVISRTFAVLGQARIGGRNVIRWSPDGRSLLTFRWSAGSDDDLVAFPVRADGSLGPQRLVASQLRTLFAGNFDVARATGRMVLGGGSATYDIWSFDLAGPDVRARRLTQGSNWYGPPVLNAAGDLLYFLRADALGNNLYTISDGRELALTAERQVVNFTGRFALDGRVFAFESMVDSGPTLAVYDIASGTLRRMPRSGLEEGWVIGRDKDIALFNLKTHTTRITDSAGGERRTIAAVPMSRSSYGSDRMLAPDGRSLAVLGDSASGVVLYRLPLDGGAITTLAVFPQTARELALSALESVVGIGLAAWSADGIYLARGGPGPNQTTLLHLDPRTGMVRQVALLPARCAPRMVSVSADGKRAACIVPDSRGDLALLEGIQP
jgi:WD40 repeat protein